MKRVFIGFLMLSVISIPGCDAEQIAAIKYELSRTKIVLDEVQKIVLEAETQLAKMEADVESLPEGPDKDEAREKLDCIKSQVHAGKVYGAKVQKHLNRLSERLEGIESGPDLLQQTVSEIGSAIPPPWGMYVSLGGLLAASIWRGVRNRNAAKNIAESVDRFLTPEMKKTITQTGTAKRIVDEVQGKKMNLPL